MFYAWKYGHTVLIGRYSADSLKFGFDIDNMASMIHADHSYGGIVWSRFQSSHSDVLIKYRVGVGDHRNPWWACSQQVNKLKYAQTQLTDGEHTFGYLIVHQGINIQQCESC